MVIVRGKGSSTFREMKSMVDKVRYLHETNGKPIKVIAKTMKVPPSTARRWIKSKRDVGRRGPPSYLTADEERQLCAAIEERAKAMNAMSTAEISAAVSSRFILNGAALIAQLFAGLRNRPEAAWGFSDRRSI
jgi:hypothetical protein